MTLNIQQHIIASLESGSRVITASHRQQRFVQTLWDQHQLSKMSTPVGSDKTREVWNDANSLSFDDWLEYLFEYFSLNSLLSSEQTVPEILDSLQQKWLFGKIVKQKLEDFSSWSSIQQETLLNNIHQAWTAYCEWLLDIQHRDIKNLFFDTEETQLFRQVVFEFEALCKKNNWISKQKLLDYLNEKINGSFPFPDNKTSLYGFIEITPQQKHFFKKIEQISANSDKFTTPKIEVIDFTRWNPVLDDTMEKQQETVSVYPCASRETEWTAAAKWSRQLAEKNVGTGIRIAVIIPQLANQQPSVFRIFQREFQPVTQLSPKKQLPGGFNFSVGENFKDLAVICTLKHWLGIFCNGRKEHWTALLGDPFCIGYEQEKYSRAHLKQQLLVLKKDCLSSRNFLEWVLTEDISQLKHWIKLTHKLVAMDKSKPKRQYPSQWSNWFQDFLNLISWPVQQMQDSITYQALDQWYQLMRSLNKMDRVCGKINLVSFERLFDEIISQQGFQPETPKAHVHVLGTLEAIGLSFDFIRITGCQADIFPSVASPNPFLPIGLQRDREMPNATPQRELDFVHTLFSGFRNLCGNISYSYAVADGDTLLLPSPLLNQFRVAPLIPQSLPESWLDVQQLVAKNLIRWQDDFGLPLSHFEVRSGVSILKDQAACPFRAYARHRLQVESLEIEQPGISAIQRGNWVHQSLEMVWRRLGNHQNLLAKTSEELQLLVQQCVEETIVKRSRKPYQKKSQLVDYEIFRTVLLVLSWLEIDKSRTAFIRVELEKESQAKIGGLSFKVRVDRVDTLADANKIIIDYKTGKPKLSSWDEQRMDEPQLPLYALIEQKISAIAFAQLNREACKLMGYGNNNIRDKGIINLENWSDQLDIWKNNLQQLAQEYIDGVATVTPRTGACDYCDLLHLCRLNARVEVTEQAVKTTDLCNAVPEGKST